MVGLDRSAAQSAFSEFLNDRSLTPPQIPLRRDGDRPANGAGCDGSIGALRGPLQQRARGEGPTSLFAGKGRVIEGIFEKFENASIRVCWPTLADRPAESLLTSIPRFLHRPFAGVTGFDHVAVDGPSPDPTLVQ